MCGGGICRLLGMVVKWNEMSKPDFEVFWGIETIVEMKVYSITDDIRTWAYALALSSSVVKNALVYHELHRPLISMKTGYVFEIFMVMATVYREKW